MKKGPPIEELTRHLAECPESFLAEPLQPNGTGTVHVAAVVSDGDGADAEAIIAHRKSQLASYRFPERIFFVAEMPLNAAGKIPRHEFVSEVMARS